MKTLRIILVVTLLVAPTLPAQIVADGATRTVLNETNSFPGDLIVGTNGSFTLLSLSDNSFVGVGGNAYIGVNNTARSNQIRLIGPTAYLSVNSNLHVGSNGPFSRLVVSNGARVENSEGRIGRIFTCGTNDVLVTGAGSVWSNASFLGVGFESAGNRLVISNGARVLSSFGALGLASTFSSNNTAVVTDAGSAWVNQTRLDVGQNGANCRLVISNAALVDNLNGTIGQSSTNCEVIVTGAGSVWSNRADLKVGEFGNFARLVVTNSGTVFAVRWDPLESTCRHASLSIL